MKSHSLPPEHFLDLAESRYEDEKQSLYLALLEAAPQSKAEAQAIIKKAHYLHEREWRKDRRRMLQFHYDGNPLLEWAMGNVLTQETVAGNLTMPDKPAPEAKIDPAIAIFLAMNRAMLLDPADKSSAFEPFFL
jgi:phage terminase large subunit-like protein